jgi:hypothetical protein
MAQGNGDRPFLKFVQESVLGLPLNDMVEIDDTSTIVRNANNAISFTPTTVVKRKKTPQTPPSSSTSSTTGASTTTGTKSSSGAAESKTKKKHQETTAQQQQQNASDDTQRTLAALAPVRLAISRNLFALIKSEKPIDSSVDTRIDASDLVKSNKSAIFSVFRHLNLVVFVNNEWYEIDGFLLDSLNKNHFINGNNVVTFKFPMRKTDDVDIFNNNNNNNNRVNVKTNGGSGATSYLSTTNSNVIASVSSNKHMYDVLPVNANTIMKETMDDFTNAQKNNSIIFGKKICSQTNILLDGRIVNANATLVNEVNGQLQPVNKDYAYPMVSIGFRTENVDASGSSLVSIDSAPGIFHACIDTNKEHAPAAVFYSRDKSNDYRYIKNAFYGIDPTPKEMVQADARMGYWGKVVDNAQHVFGLNFPSMMGFNLFYRFCELYEQFSAQNHNTREPWMDNVDRLVKKFRAKYKPKDFLVPSVKLSDDYASNIAEMLRPIDESKQKKHVKRVRSIYGNAAPPPTMLGVQYFKFNDTLSQYYLPVRFARFVIDEYSTVQAPVNVIRGNQMLMNASIYGTSYKAVWANEEYHNKTIEVEAHLNTVHVTPVMYVVMSKISDKLPTKEEIAESKKFCEAEGFYNEDDESDSDDDSDGEEEAESKKKQPSSSDFKKKSK